MRHCASLYIKRLQFKVGVDKKSAGSAGPGSIGFEFGLVGNILYELQIWPQIFWQPPQLQTNKENISKFFVKTLVSFRSFGIVSGREQNYRRCALLNPRGESRAKRGYLCSQLWNSKQICVISLIIFRVGINTKMKAF